jgi:hypothetical protein
MSLLVIVSWPYRAGCGAMEICELWPLGWSVESNRAKRVSLLWAWWHGRLYCAGYWAELQEGFGARCCVRLQGRLPWKCQFEYFVQYLSSEQKDSIAVRNCNCLLTLITGPIICYVDWRRSCFSSVPPDHAGTVSRLYPGNRVLNSLQSICHESATVWVT